MFEIQVFERDPEGRIVGILLMKAEYFTQLGDAGKTVLLLEGVSPSDNIIKMEQTSIFDEINHCERARNVVNSAADSFIDFIHNNWHESCNDFTRDVLIELGHDPDAMDQDSYDEYRSQIAGIIQQVAVGSVDCLPAVLD